MCGISAIVRWGDAAPIDLRTLAQMHGALRHRGPDGEGCFTVDANLQGWRLERVPEPGQSITDGLKVAAAVRRLRVSDLRPEADQPLVSPDGRTCVILNGAIYNHRVLAAELSSAGCRFQTTADTETVMWAYRRWGVGCFARFQGMWAILIIDLERGQLVGSRDRLGIKPLYYAYADGHLLLCSEPGVLARAQSDGPRVEEARLFEFLSGYPPRSSALSFFRDVEPVPAASWFEIDLRTGPAQPPRFQNYWNLSDFRAGMRVPELSFAEAAERYRELLQSSVEAHSTADARVGSLLSGGLDTPTLVAFWAQAAARRKAAKPETYSIAWDDPRMSERPNIDAVAAKFGVRSHVLQLSAAQVWSAVDRVVAALGQPLLGQELIAQHYAYGLAREHGAVVVLDGTGSDELQAGLPIYEAEMVLERLERLHWLDLARELHCMARAYRRSHAQIVRAYLIGPLLRHYREGRGLPRHSWLDARAVDSPAESWRRATAIDQSCDASRLNRLLYRETRHTNVPTTLMYGDRNAMAHSIEARFPYLDHPLVEFCFSLPASYKVGFGRRKRLLFEAAKDVLPQPVLARKEKMKFVPTTNWMPLRERAEAIREASRSEAFTRLPWIDRPKMHAFVDGFLAGNHDDAYAVWRIYTASRWLHLFKL